MNIILEFMCCEVRAYCDHNGPVVHSVCDETGRDVMQNIPDRNWGKLVSAVESEYAERS